MILDDATAHKCAQSFSLALKGTLAVIVLARQQGLIQAAAPVVRDLQAVGFRIDDQLVRTVLQTVVDETWPAA